MARVAEHLRDAVDQAVDVAQLVVDPVKEIVVIAGLAVTYASIPIFGQIQLANKLRDVLRLAWDARKVLAVFWNFLVFIRDGFGGRRLLDRGLAPAGAGPTRGGGMSEQLDAARRELREALAMARASLAQVRGRPTPSLGAALPDGSHPHLELDDDDA